MASIYLIEDINDLKYVGSTTRKLNERLGGHRSHKRRGQHVSSSKLNLDNCIITQLERCNLEDRKERERYWINNIDCVNERKLNGPDKEWRENNKQKQKEWRENNKEKRKQYLKEWYQKNKEKRTEKHKEWYQKNKEKRTEQHKEWCKNNKAGILLEKENENPKL